MIVTIIYISCWILIIIATLYVKKLKIDILNYQTKIRKEIQFRITSKKYIYVFRQGIYIKIGRTTNVLKRLLDHQTSNVHNLHILAIIPVKDDIFAETLLHRKYKKLRYKREFFYLSPKLLFDILLLNHVASRQQVKVKLKL